jgi:hypothetical protein
MAYIAAVAIATANSGCHQRPDERQFSPTQSKNRWSALLIELPSDGGRRFLDREESGVISVMQTARQALEKEFMKNLWILQPLDQDFATGNPAAALERLQRVAELLACPVDAAGGAGQGARLLLLTAAGTPGARRQ